MVQAHELMLSQFQAVQPGLKGQIQPDESVRKGIQVIDNLDTESSGLLLSQNGNQTNWF